MENRREIRWSIRWKLLSAMTGLIIAILLALTFIQIAGQKEVMESELNRRIKILKRNLMDRGKTLSGNLARLTENNIATYNLSNIAVIIEKAIKKNEELSYAILMDSSRTAFIHTISPEKQQTEISSEEDVFASKQEAANVNEYEKDGKSYIEFIVPIHVSIQPWGWLRLGFSQEMLNNEIIKSKKEISEQARTMIFRSIYTAVAFIIVGSGIILLISSRLSRPLRALTKSADELAKGNFDISLKIEGHSKDEVGVLYDAFLEMSKDLGRSQAMLEDYSRTLENKVKDRTQELSKAYDNLKLSQEQLVESEKMASLGQLVAGVAHEINTPIGIGVTTSTHFIEITDAIAASFEDKSMTKSSLQKYFSSAKQAGDLIFRNLVRTSELIKSFKMVSADQTSHEKRKFNIKTYLHDILASLRPKIKKTKLDIAINCRDNININSYPGAVAQIITNFIMNSINHAYESPATGNIIIDVKESGNDYITLKYSDDGKGIPEESLKKIFDPFFTTRRGEGGTGLGLNIVYNIVTQTLKGKIKCESEVGKGAAFIVELPVNV